MNLRSRISTIERRAGSVATCRCRLDIVHADRGPIPPLARCPDCGGEPARVVIRRADPSVNYSPERWADGPDRYLRTEKV